MAPVTVDDVRAIAVGYDVDPARSMSLHSQAYTDPRWLEADLAGIVARTWQWVCHVERLAAPGSYVSATIAEMPIVVVRDRQGALRAFYNVQAPRP